MGAIGLLSFSILVGLIFLGSLTNPKNLNLSDPLIETQIKEEAATVWYNTLVKETVETPSAYLADISRLVIPDLGVDAPLENKGVKAGKMEDPSTADVVAWYDLSPLFPVSNNIVLAGHFTLNKDPAVFHYLRDLSVGDEVSLSLWNQVRTYRVSRSTIRSPDENWDYIVGPSSQEILTLIACDGVFLPQLDDYSHRRVIEAVRVS